MPLRREQSCSDSDDMYPSYGAGVHFIVKPEEHMLLNLEYAHGSLNNYGIYLTLGYNGEARLPHGSCGAPWKWQAQMSGR